MKYFSHIPHFKEKIESGKYGQEDLLSMIKTADYNNRFEESKPIFFDEYWQEVSDPEKARYKANITSRMDSIWTLEYSEGDVKLYSANYSSFYPNIKNGEFISYYPDGTTRQKIHYRNDSLKEVRNFYENGSLRNHYTCSERKSAVKGEKGIDIIYVSVIDASGNNIFNPEGDAVQKVFDDFSNTEYTNIYRKNRLVSSYRMLGSDTVYLITDPDYDFNIKPLHYYYDNNMFRQMNQQQIFRDMYKSVPAGRP